MEGQPNLAVITLAIIVKCERRTSDSIEFDVELV